MDSVEDPLEELAFGASVTDIECADVETIRYGDPEVVLFKRIEFNNQVQ